MPTDGRHRRRFIQARDLRQEAKSKQKDFDAIVGRVRTDYDKLRETGIVCHAFVEGDETEVIEVTRLCWNHIFRHPHKRPSKIEKLERALSYDLALKLLRRTTTYQEVSREKDRGGNTWLYFGIIGYVRGVRMKVILRKQEKSTNPKKILFSFSELSG
jgi:hypothetical protein